MGQVLGFSHCQEYGSVVSTPDSTPPCTDGGNEESELCELQTAREWSDDEDGAGPDEDDGLASSPSIWGTPRQNSFEQTFSYIAIAEATGAARQHRDRRGRAGSRGSRASVICTDTMEPLLDSPDVEWDPNSFLAQEEEEVAWGCAEASGVSAEETSGEHKDSETVTVQPSPQSPTPDSQRDAGVQREELVSGRTIQAPPPSTSSQTQSTSHAHQAAESSPAPVLDAPVSRETNSVKLLTSVPPKSATSSLAAAVGPHSQEQAAGGHWCSAPNLSEDPMARKLVAVVDLIYWKDTERTGMVLTGLVVGLLSLFQLSIITVVSTVSLAIVCCTISVRIYYGLIHALKWGDGEHPFKTYLDLDISFSGEEAERCTQKAIVMFLSAIDSLKGLFFVKSLFESLKLLVLMYLVTYLGRLCNGLTVLIIGVIAVFSLPLFYKRHQEKVDGFFAKIQAHVDNIKDIFQRLAQGGGPPPDSTPGGAKPKNQ
ncbi:reticulon-2a isoform X1 [Takifugu flavidus]|uniref:reticulon-2a isoform X1 n=1 Tax=Takifugu flavidus TaxID=433684 RepID=UPI002544D074|nr:reticulon-2a isoform X1 [Takifugu flavidus]